uniref:Galectin n=1 Tax=Meloidogyne incognita TaxID=6306 RepID=A0A914NDP7_MELIC
MLEKGVTLFASFRLTKYYVWSGFSSNLWGSEFVVTKYWHDTKWWDGQLFKGNGSNTLKIFGDFVTVTPVFIRTLNYDDIKYFSEAYTHVVDTGHTFDLPTIYNENVTFRFYCKYKGELAEIRLYSNRKPILEWYNLEHGIATKDYAEGKTRRTEIPFIINKETKVFELNIIANKTSDTMTKYEFEINGVKYLDSTIITAVPPWKIDQIKVNSIGNRTQLIVGRGGF